jgi:hypothetical protein
MRGIDATYANRIAGSLEIGKLPCKRGLRRQAQYTVFRSDMFACEV